jgi:hypothetical protein
MAPTPQNLKVSSSTATLECSTAEPSEKESTNF